MKAKLIDIGANITSFTYDGWAYCMDFYDLMTFCFDVLSSLEAFFLFTVGIVSKK
ncbi:hypothetical protein NV379_05110 [Paenibacillus sp. N1-5-1-14]|uniref:hypothetical protein n=1 Tax=Paenibacillus radicibacter TaxID=2972488 RepID=UPI002158D201|nr:hypothetical protein [Paenibacillus radicibacter]MCR8642030.1 hypothetical protein [Paenibacillus radicibacter]